MTTDEKIAAMVAAYPPVLQDANPVCICVCSVAIVFQFYVFVNGVTLQSMNCFHRMNSLLSYFVVHMTAFGRSFFVMRCYLGGRLCHGRLLNKVLDILTISGP